MGRLRKILDENEQYTNYDKSDTAEGQKPPTNYRVGDFGHACANCKHYRETDSQCQLYEVRVDGGWVCDSWKAVYKD